MSCGLEPPLNSARDARGFSASGQSLRSGSREGSPPFSRTLTIRPIEAMRSVHVNFKGTEVIKSPPQYRPIDEGEV